MKTIVTIDMAERIAAHYGVRTINVLTGFKYIGEQIGLLEQAGKLDSFVFGLEESYGYLSGTYVRDKCGVVSSLLTEVVGKIMGPGVELINAGAESAWELKRTLTATDALAPERAGSYQLYASDITGDFATLAGRFLNEEVPPVEGVDIDLY